MAEIVNLPTKNLPARQQDLLVSILAFEAMPLAEAREMARQPLKTVLATLDQKRSRQGQPVTKRELSAALVRLSAIYYRPDQPGGLTDAMLSDYFADLSGAGITKAMLDDACGTYRRDGTNRFFPTPGQLLDLCRDDLRWRDRALRALDRAQELLTAAQAPVREA